MADIQRVVTEAVFRDEMSAGMAAAAGAADKLNAAIDRQEASARRAGPTAEALVRRLDAVTKAEAALEAATARAARQQATLQAGLAAGTVTAEQVARATATQATEIAKAEAALAGARAGANAVATANASLAASNTKVADSGKLAAWQMKQLALQTPDVVQGLLGGISPFQVLLQQGGQVVQVMGGVSNAIRGVASLIGSALASPAGVVVVATAAMAALGYAAESADRRMIGLQNSLRATRDDYASLAGMVNETAKRIAASSTISAGDARAAGTLLAASPAFGGSSADLERNIRLARDLATVMGTDLPQAATRLTAAMRDPGAEAQRLADGGFRSMSQALANSIKLQAEAGDKAGAYARVIDAMGQVVDRAGEPQTRLQKAVGELSNQFTAAGQSGKSLAQEIGGVITDAAAWAIERTTAFINTLQRLRDLLPQIVPAAPAGSGGAAPSFLPELPGGRLLDAFRNFLSGRDPTSQRRAGGGAVVGPSLAPDLSGYSPQVLSLAQAIAMKESGGQHTDRYGNVKVVDSGDGTGPRVGMFQLGDAFVRDFAPGTDVMTREGNISAALKGIDALLTWAGGDALKAALAFRLGQAGAEAVLRGDRVASPAVTSYVNDVSGGDLGARVQAARDGRMLADQAFVGSRGVLSARIAENSAQQQLMERGIAQAAAGGDDATVARLTERLRELRGAATDLISEQEKLARSARDAVVPLQAEEGATRDLAAIRQQFVEAARRSGTAVDEGALAVAQAAKLETLSVAFDDQVDALNRRADAEQQFLPLLEKGGRAADLATARTKALEEARKSTLPGTEARRLAEEKMTTALMRVADVERDRQAAIDVAGFDRQLEFAQTELSLLTATADKRAEELAILQERHKLGLRLGEQATVEQQKALDAAAAVARVGTELQRQRAGLEALAGGIIQIFDRVGDAITDAFVQGSGAAVNFGNVAKAIGAQVLSMFTRLGVVAPITNALFGRSEATLWSGLAAVAGGGQAAGGGGGTGIMDLLGLTNFLPKDGIMSALGLSGSGGWMASANSYLFGNAPQVVAGGTETIAGTSGLLGSGGAASLPAIAGAAGIGFGAGSLLNSLLGRTGSQSTNGTIGAGVGTGLGVAAGLAMDLAFPGLGTLVTLLGGLAGGGLGGLFGPGESVKGYGYGLGAASDGLLSMTSAFYNDEGKTAFKEAENGIAAMNEWLVRFGVTVGGAASVGGNRFGADYSNATAGSFGEALGQLYYHAADPQLEAALAARGNRFGSAEEMQAFVQGFTEVQALIKQMTAEPIPAFTQQMEAVTSTFDAAIARAREYGIAEDGLTAARVKAVAELERQRAETLRNTRDTLAIRRLAADGSDMEAELARQTLNARTELAQFTDELDKLALSAAERADLLVQLEETQAAERAKIIREYGEEAANALRAAGGAIRSYLNNLAAGPGGGASPMDRLTAARSQFSQDRTLAMGGDRDALGRITSTADLLLNAGREVYASGAGFQAIRYEIQQSLAALPVVQSYDAMQTAALEAIQEALENGTLTTAISPSGNLVTVAGGISLARTEALLAAMQASMYEIGDALNRQIFGGTQMALDVGRVLNQVIVDGTAAAYEVGRVLNEVIVAGTAAAYEVGSGLNKAINTVVAQLILARGDVLTSAANIVSAIAAMAGPTVTAINAGNTIAADASRASTESLAAMNRIMVDASAAATAGTAQVNTHLAGIRTQLIGFWTPTNAHLGEISVATKDVATQVMTHITLLRGQMAINITDLKTATAAGFAAANTIAVDAAKAATTGTALTNTLLDQVRSAAANDNLLRDLNASLGTVDRSVRDVNASLATVDRSAKDINASLATVDASTRQVGTQVMTQATLLRGGLAINLSDLEDALVASTDRVATQVMTQTTLLRGQMAINIADLKAAAVASQDAGNRIAVDASAAQVAAQNTGNGLVVSIGNAHTARLVDLNTSLGTIDRSVRDVNTSLATVHGAVSAGNTIAADASRANTASLAAANTIAADAANAATRSMAALNTITVDVGNAQVRILSDMLAEARAIRAEMTAMRQAEVATTQAVREAGVQVAAEVRSGTTGTTEAVGRLNDTIERKVALR